MRILVISAHPDDAEFAAGGILMKLAKRHEVTLAVLTDGSAGTYGDTKTRRKEQEKAAETLGADMIWLGRPDCSLQHDLEHTMLIAQLIRDTEPQVILSTHWDQTGGINDYRAHPEHRIAGELAKDAARYARFNLEGLKGEKHRAKNVLYYMVSEKRTPKVAVAIDDVASELQELWECHQSQHQLIGGGLVEYLKKQRTQAAQPYDTEMVEFLDADEPISSALLSELFG